MRVRWSRASLILASVSASASVAPGAAQGLAQPNILILVADDLGVEQLASYGVGSDYPATPTLDALAAGGVRFRNAYANSNCSPTRATLMTGRYSFRTGIGIGVVEGEGGLPLEEFTLPEMLDLGTDFSYAHGAFGKWHLGSTHLGGDLAPNLAGWSHFSGHIDNFLAPNTYNSWNHVTNGVSTPTTVYATTAETDAFLAWVATQTQPWLAYVAFHAPHGPFHTPPAALHSVDLSTAGPPFVDSRPYYKAMVEAMDTEIGRLLTELGSTLDDTVVLFVADNGTPEAAVIPGTPEGQHKGPLTEGGTHVPLIVSLPRGTSAGMECLALVNTTDVFATVAELAGVDLPALTSTGYELDSVSLVPYFDDPALPSVRAHAYAEGFGPNGPGPYFDTRRTLRGERYKLVRFLESEEHFYDLSEGLYEGADLLEGVLDPEEQTAYDELFAAYLELLDFLPAEATVYGDALNPADSLILISGAPKVGGSLLVGLDNPLGTQAAGALATLFFAFQPDPAFPFGTPIPGLGMSGAGSPGELLISPAAYTGLFLPAPPWPGPGSPSILAVPFPPDPNLVGFHIFGQGLLFDPQGAQGVTYGLTQGVDLRIGP